MCAYADRPKGESDALEVLPLPGFAELAMLLRPFPGGEDARRHGPGADEFAHRPVNPAYVEQVILLAFRQHDVLLQVVQNPVQGVLLDRNEEVPRRLRAGDVHPLGDAPFENGTWQALRGNERGGPLAVAGLEQRDELLGFACRICFNRPALKRLLDHVRARRIDVIVVYKVDRLTRRQPSGFWRTRSRIIGEDPFCPLGLWRDAGGSFSRPWTPIATESSWEAISATVLKADVSDPGRWRREWGHVRGFQRGGRRLRIHGAPDNGIKDGWMFGNRS